MLLSLRYSAWQIADFGLTHEGASGMSIVTGLSRGSEGYRGPEMIKDRSVVAQQTDIFALGCTLGEVITGKQLFPRDFDVFHYMYTAKLPTTPPLEVDNRSNVYISELMRAMLGLNWRKRPTASDILNEIGDPEISWETSLVVRTKEMDYPNQDSPTWLEMRWKPYWYGPNDLTNFSSQTCEWVESLPISEPIEHSREIRLGFICECNQSEKQNIKWKFR